MQRLSAQAQPVAQTDAPPSTIVIGATNRCALRLWRQPEFRRRVQLTMATVDAAENRGHGGISRLPLHAETQWALDEFVAQRRRRL